MLKGLDEHKDDNEYHDYERERTSSFTTFRKEQPIYENVKQMKTTAFKQCSRYEKEITEAEFPTATLPEQIEDSQAWSKQLSPSITNSNFGKFDDKNISIGLITIDESSTDPLSAHIDKFNEISEELERTSSANTRTEDVEKEEIPVTIIDEPFQTSDLIMSPGATHRQVSRFSLDKSPEEEERSIITKSSMDSVNDEFEETEFYSNIPKNDDKYSPTREIFTSKSEAKEEVQSPVEEEVEEKFNKLENCETSENPIIDDTENVELEHLSSPTAAKSFTSDYYENVSILKINKDLNVSSDSHEEEIINSHSPELESPKTLLEKTNSTEIPEDDNHQSLQDEPVGSFVENLKKFDTLNKSTFHENNSTKSNKQNRNTIISLRQSYKEDVNEKEDTSQNQIEAAIAITQSINEEIFTDRKDLTEQDVSSKKRSLRNSSEKTDSPILQVARRYSVVESEQVNNLGKVSSSPFLNKAESQEVAQPIVNSPEKKVRLSGSVDSLDEMTIEQLEVKENVPVKVSINPTSFSSKSNSKPIPKPRRSIESNVARSAPEPEMRKDSIKSHIESLRSRERSSDTGIKQLETKTSSTFSLSKSQKSKERIDSTPEVQRIVESLPKFGETSRLFSAKSVKEDKPERKEVNEEENLENNSTSTSKQGSVR